MILNNEELVKLKTLIFYDPDDEEEYNNCVKCTVENPSCNCNLISICNKYGSFNFVGGAEDIVKDLFDTIESLKDELFNVRREI